MLNKAWEKGSVWNSWIEKVIWKKFSFIPVFADLMFIKMPEHSNVAYVRSVFKKNVITLIILAINYFKI